MTTKPTTESLCEEAVFFARIPEHDATPWRVGLHSIVTALVARTRETEAALVGLREAAEMRTANPRCMDHAQPLKWCINCQADDASEDGLRIALTDSAPLGARIIAEAVERGRAAAESRGARAMLRIVERRLRYVADETYGPHAVGLRLAVAEMTPLGMDVVLNGIVERDAREGGGK